MRRCRIVRAPSPLHDTDDLVHGDVTHGQEVLLAENLPSLVLEVASLEGGQECSLRGGETPSVMVPQTWYRHKLMKVPMIDLQRLIQRIRSKHGKGKALGILAARLGRASYYMLRRSTPFDMDRFMN